MLIGSSQGAKLLLTPVGCLVIISKHFVSALAQICPVSFLQLELLLCLSRPEVFPLYPGHSSTLTMADVSPRATKWQQQLLSEVQSRAQFSLWAWLLSCLLPKRTGGSTEKGNCLHRSRLISLGGHVGTSDAGRQHAQADGLRPGV